MKEKINIRNLNEKQHQALVCMFFAMLPRSDNRYKKRDEYWKILGEKFNIKPSTYKLNKDSFDKYFPNNGRKGFEDDRDLITRVGKDYVSIYNKFKDYPIEIIENAVDEIIQLYTNAYTNEFITLKCGIPETVHTILKNSNNIIIDGVYTLKNQLKLNKIVFITLGGDVNKKEIDWNPGFKGIGHITKEPYDTGYSGDSKYFKFEISIDCLFDNSYKREHFFRYPDTFNATFIGPELKRDPTQAISILTENKAISVIRAVLDDNPSLKKNFDNIFSSKFMQQVLGDVKVLIPTISSYGENIEDVLSRMINNKTKKNSKLIFKTGKKYTSSNNIDFEYNRIIFGAPGTGKSYTLNKDKEDLIKKNENYERVTFHPDYSYANFVGTYKPVNNDNDEISYKYVPGPFLRILVKALESNMNDTPEPFLLIIEEINRANPAAVFGDIFQLLDRNNGVSEYPIHTSEDMKKYISEELKIPADQCAELRIPDNMFIWATMNSADQGVFPMDTAFKRRWNFEYCGINKKEEELNKQTTLDIIINNDPEPIHWNSIRKAINCELTEIKVNEDKQLGPFFLNVNDLMDRYSDNKSKLQEKFNDLFKDKIIMYLFEDAAKQKKDFIFSGIENPRIYSEICKEYDEKGLKIFGEDFTNKVKEFEAKAKSSGDDL